MYQFSNLIKYKMYLLVFFSIILFSCEKNNSSETLMFITPELNYISCNTGEVVQIRINCESSYKLSQFTISSKKENNYSQIELDTILNSNKFSTVFEFYIDVPELDSSYTTLIFSVIDEEGNNISMAKVLYILDQEYLEETTGHVLYSSLSNKEDGFNLENNTFHFSNILKDSLLIDIRDRTDSIPNGDELSRSVESFTGVKFMRFNDFDYARATLASLIAVYKSGTPHEYINDVSERDIILMSKGDSLYYAIKVHYVNDNTDTNEDNYVFSLKK